MTGSLDDWSIAWQTRFKIDFDELSAAYDRARSVGLNDEVLAKMQVEKRLVDVKRMQRASAGLEKVLAGFAPATADIPTLVLALDEARSAGDTPSRNLISALPSAIRSPTAC